MIQSHLGPSAGIGLRSPHMAEILKRRPSAGWLEVHAENYMNGGPQMAALDRIRGHYSLSVHGVGLSLGSAGGIDAAHLARLKAVCDRTQPVLVSEHMAWSVGEASISTTCFRCRMTKRRWPRCAAMSSVRRMR